MAERYVTVPVLVLQDGRKFMAHELKFYKREEYSAEYIFDESSYSNGRTSMNMIPMLYDIKKKKLVDPEIVHIYPENKQKVGQTFYVQENSCGRKLKKCILTSIEYIEYDVSISTFGKIENYYSKYLDSSKTRTPKDIIEIRQYKSTYVFDNGFKTNYDMYMFGVEE